MKKIHKPTDKTYDSKFEEDFAELWKSQSNIPIIHHHIIVVSRAWEIDFAFPEIKLAIELQGHGRGHTSYLGMSRDCRKHNDLLLIGWNLLYFMSIDMKSDYITKTIKKYLEINNHVRSHNITQKDDRNSAITDPLLIAKRRLQNQKFN